MVTGDEIISEHVLVPDAIIFLPVASVFINTAETDFRAKILKSLHASSQVLQPVQRLESIKSILCGHGLLLKPFRSGQDCCATGFPLPAVKAVRGQEY